MEMIIGDIKKIDLGISSFERMSFLNKRFVSLAIGATIVLPAMLANGMGLNAAPLGCKKASDNQ